MPKTKLKYFNEMSVTFSAVSENEAFARAVAASFISELDPLVSELAEIKTAVSEAVTNCIVHAYRNIPNGSITMLIRLLPDRRVYIKIRDKGCGISNVAQAMEPLFTTAPEEERAGLGFAVMKSFTDRLTVKSSVGKGTALVMEKTLQERLEREDNGSSEANSSAKSRRKPRSGTPMRQ